MSRTKIEETEKEVSFVTMLFIDPLKHRVAIPENVGPEGNTLNCLHSVFSSSSFLTLCGPECQLFFDCL